MKYNYYKLSTGDVIQLDDIIHISKIKEHDQHIYYYILYADKYQLKIECDDLNQATQDRNEILKKIGINS